MLRSILITVRTGYHNTSRYLIQDPSAGHAMLESMPSLANAFLDVLRRIRNHNATFAGWPTTPRRINQDPSARQLRKHVDVTCDSVPSSVVPKLGSTGHSGMQAEIATFDLD
ncbi:hypothetical protein Y032_0412g983 [Ancylostoma ceylanicum]|uniref:Uncharacterized protein n=1 Tax=Ancylostoma ceylanicum TaxID=53326 RepID=A0A016X377_9BILA|nr:hypothetical protein Y032_0412g983 [Ancylostoma ceylanicum]